MEPLEASGLSTCPGGVYIGLADWVQGGGELCGCETKRQGHGASHQRPHLDSLFSITNKVSNKRAANRPEILVSVPLQCFPAAGPSNEMDVSAIVMPLTAIA